MKMSVSDIVRKAVNQFALARVELVHLDIAPVALIERKRFLLANHLITRAIPSDESKLRIVVDA
ncbi:hypothetical protein AQ914_18140 [Burkholderia pseudomallei]|nr:hypothetical protein AQ914_18140 [Burkholderia pseudomallei]